MRHLVGVIRAAACVGLLGQQMRRIVVRQPDFGFLSGCMDHFGSATWLAAWLFTIVVEEGCRHLLGRKLLQVGEVVLGGGVALRGLCSCFYRQEQLWRMVLQLERVCEC